MKMETVIPASATGIVERVLVSAGDNVAADDLLAVIGDAKPPTTGGGGQGGEALGAVVLSTAHRWRSSGRSKCSANKYPYAGRVDRESWMLDGA